MKRSDKIANCHLNSDESRKQDSFLFEPIKQNYHFIARSRDEDEHSLGKSERDTVQINLVKIKHSG